MAETCVAKYDRSTSAAYYSKHSQIALKLLLWMSSCVLDCAALQDEYLGKDKKHGMQRSGADCRLHGRYRHSLVLCMDFGESILCPLLCTWPLQTIEAGGRSDQAFDARLSCASRSLMFRFTWWWATGVPLSALASSALYCESGRLLKAQIWWWHIQAHSTYKQFWCTDTVLISIKGFRM